MHSGVRYFRERAYLPSISFAVLQMVAASRLHVQVGVGHGVADLLKGTARSEHRKAGHEGDIAHGGQAGGDAHHVGLGDAAVKMPLRERLLKHAGFGCGGQVGVQHHYFIIFSA